MTDIVSSTPQVPAADDNQYFGGCTNWARYSVAELKYMLEEDHQQAWNQVTAWNHTAALVSEYHTVLAKIRERVLAYWRTEQSEAAKGFVALIEQILGGLNSVERAAAANKESLVDVLYAITTARARITEVHSEWSANQRADDAVWTSILEYLPRATPRWQDDLNSQAIGHMLNMDREIFLAARHMEIPPTPEALPAGARTDSVSDSAENTNRTSWQPRTSPPHSTPDAAGTTGPPDDAHHPQLDGVAAPTIHQGLPHMPDQGGYTHQNEPPAARIGHDGVLWPPPTSGQTYPGTIPLSPMVPYARPSSSGYGASTPTQHANPVGGLIPPAGRRATGKTPPSSSGGNETWDLEEGVPSVLSSAPEPLTFDPGRGVFGLDR